MNEWYETKDQDLGIVAAIASSWLVLQICIGLVEQRLLRITIGEHKVGVSLEFDADGISTFCVNSLFPETGHSFPDHPSRLKIELMAPGVTDIFTGRSAGLSFSGVIWPGYRGTVEGLVLKSTTTPKNLNNERSRHILIDDNGQICLDRAGGYSHARICFDVDGEALSFEVPWPDVSVVRIREDGSPRHVPINSTVLLSNQSRNDTVTISCPDNGATLVVLGKEELHPFYKGTLYLFAAIAGNPMWRSGTMVNFCCRVKT